MRFCKETVEEVVSDILPLIEKHYNEIARYKELPLRPDFDLYKQLERLGAIRLFTARTNDQKLVGYSIFFFRFHQHYSESKVAIADLLFIDPDHRGFGMTFLRWMDEELKSEGVQVVYHSSPAKQDIGPLFKRLGYELTEYIYSRRL